MTSDEEIKSIDDEISHISEEIDRFSSTKHEFIKKLNDKKHLILMKKLTESDWLRNSEWKLGIHYTEIFIELVKSPIKEIVYNLRELFDVSWHSSVSLTENLNMRFDDNEIRIFIDKDPPDDVEIAKKLGIYDSNQALREYCANKYKIGLNKLIEFVNSYGIKINLEPLTSEIEKLEYLKLLQDDLNIKINKDLIK